MRVLPEPKTLGSGSALSLLTNADGSLTSLVAAGVAAGAVAAIFVYSAISSTIKEKHKKKIERVNALHAQYLKNIVVPNRGKIQGFPAIFQLINDQYQSMSFTPEQIKDIGFSVARQGGASSDSYGNSLRNAINKLKEYYLVRTGGQPAAPDDITASVLAYVMYILESKCLRFSGYDYDIAYLDAICKFINAYASDGNEENSRRFRRLSPVYSFLLQAKQGLEKHREALSLQETIAELKESCVCHSDSLIRMLVKMVVRDDDTELVDTVAHEELQVGILRKHYVRSEIKGFELRSDKEIKIPESIFSEWIKNLSEYYLRSLSIEVGEDETSVSANSFFSFLETAKQAFDQKTLISSKERAKIVRELGRIQGVFKDSGNFISSHFNSKSKKFEIVSEPLDLIERSRAMAYLARLAHEMISLQYLCTHLLKCIQMLGDIYVRNPAYFVQIFHVLERLCMLIEGEVKATKAMFTDLQKNNQNNMQLQEKEEFPNQIRELLISIATEIKTLGSRVKEYRQMATKDILEGAASKVKYEMLEIATNISKIYFPSEPIEPIVEEAKPQSLPKEPDATPPVRELPPAIEKKPSKIVLNDSKNSVPARPVADADRLEQLAADMQNRITDIQKAEPQRATRYLAMYDALLALKNKSLAISHERAVEQSNKPAKVLALTAGLFEYTLAFLQRPQEEQRANAGAFFAEIHTRLNSPENAEFIDHHRNDFSRYLYSHLCSQSIFRTQTRRKLVDFEATCMDFLKMR